MQIRTTICLFFLLGLVACGSGSRWDYRADQHIVRKGETLYTIAWRYGKDANQLARWNRLGDGSLIYPGQVLRLTSPSASAPASRSTGSTASSQSLPSISAQLPPTWSWPTAGTVSVVFGGKPGTGTGVLINGKAGQAVYAAASGDVVYAGSGLIGYGELIILKHNDTYLSAYGYNASLMVKEGQSIRKGQQIATRGEGPERKPRLHFEIRRNGKPVNPQQHLPAR